MRSVSNPEHRHPGEGRDLDLSLCRNGEIPAFAGMTVSVRKMALRAKKKAGPRKANRPLE